jgi:hypothetical protein
MNAKRVEKAITQLRIAESDLRAEWITALREVAAGGNTLFFAVGDIGYGRPLQEPDILIKARDVAAMADHLGATSPESVAPQIIRAFAVANARANEHRLGPIRLAQTLLDELGAASVRHTGG